MRTLCAFATLANRTVANPCDAAFGPFAVKCGRCRKAKHACVAVEPPLFPALAAVSESRAAYAASLLDDNANSEALADTARAAADDLKTRLRTYDRNRNKTTGDRPTPRKARAGAAPAASNDALLLELQSIRRGILALVEVRKLVSFPAFLWLSFSDASANRMRSTFATSLSRARPCRLWMRPLGPTPLPLPSRRRASRR